MHVTRLRALAASLALLAGGVALVNVSRADAANPKVCAMLSASELRGWFGKEMTVSKLPGIVDCQWVPAAGSDGSLTVQIVSARYYEEPSLAKGFTKLRGIGDGGFVAKDFPKWRAGAWKGKKAVMIGVDGEKTTRETAIAILKTLVRKI